MAAVPQELKTQRLILRQWRDGDREAFAAMNADREVMRYFQARRSRAESDALIEYFRENWRRDGFSFRAVEEKGSGALIGFCGLNRPAFPQHLMPCVEIGWRLCRDAWGKGFATEAARASLEHGFQALGLEQVIALSVAGNARSRAVMQRLGMHRDPGDDFDDPDLPVDSSLRPLVVYRLDRKDWKA